MDYSTEMDSSATLAELNIKKARLIAEDLLGRWTSNEKPSLGGVREFITAGVGSDISTQAIYTVDWIQEYSATVKFMDIIFDYILATDNALDAFMKAVETENKKKHEAQRALEAAS